MDYTAEGKIDNFEQKKISKGTAFSHAVNCTRYPGLKAMKNS
jgi:hypothetical protein